RFFSCLRGWTGWDFCPSAPGRGLSSAPHCAERPANVLEHDPNSRSLAALPRWDRVPHDEFFHRLGWYPHGSSALDPRELSQGQPKTDSPLLNSQPLGNLLNSQQVFLHI